MRLGPQPFTNVDVFRKRGFDFFLVSGHLVPLFEGNQFNALRAEAQGGPGHVHRHVAAADDQHPAFDGGFFGHAGIAEKFNAVQHARFYPRLPRGACGSFARRRK